MGVDVVVYEDVHRRRDDTWRLDRPDPRRRMRDRQGMSRVVFRADILDIRLVVENLVVSGRPCGDRIFDLARGRHLFADLEMQAVGGRNRDGKSIDQRRFLRITFLRPRAGQRGQGQENQ
ncbi:MAG: hypothetical protein JWL77_1578 [Chthonomonadaceae bacterium]|nr:hypothetical protein [Chthonomonadaceae bacterium]